MPFFTAPQGAPHTRRPRRAEIGSVNHKQASARSPKRVAYRRAKTGADPRRPDRSAFGVIERGRTGQRARHQRRAGPLPRCAVQIRRPRSADTEDKDPSWRPPRKVSGSSERQEIAADEAGPPGAASATQQAVPDRCVPAYIQNIQRVAIAVGLRPHDRLPAHGLLARSWVPSGTSNCHARVTTRVAQPVSRRDIARRSAQVRRGCLDMAE